MTRYRTQVARCPSQRRRGRKRGAPTCIARKDKTASDVPGFGSWFRLVLDLGASGEPERDTKHGDESRHAGEDHTARGRLEAHGVNERLGLESEARARSEAHAKAQGRLQRIECRGHRNAYEEDRGCHEDARDKGCAESEKGVLVCFDGPERRHTKDGHGAFMRGVRRLDQTQGL